eukprot:gb/GECH01012610.1/.p1 GENE.gb/GECH01012610.1/~~gb/GECH01012610.1/.p1  ORF type:complete len:310 (+),score=58.99 gb/GECH01012610.1/:1-930(+)
MANDYRFEKALSPAIPDHHHIGSKHPLRDWDQHTRALHALIYDHTFPCWVHSVLNLLHSGQFKPSLTSEDIDTVSVVAPNTGHILKKLFLSKKEIENPQNVSNWLRVCAESVGPHSASESSNLSHSCYAGRLLSTVYRLSNDIISGVENATKQPGTVDSINCHSYVCQNLILHAHLLLRLRSSLSSAASTVQPLETSIQSSSPVEESAPNSASSCSSASVSSLSSVSPSSASENESHDSGAHSVNSLPWEGYEWFEDTNDGFENSFFEKPGEHSPDLTLNNKATHDEQTAFDGPYSNDAPSLFMDLAWK